LFNQVFHQAPDVALAGEQSMSPDTRPVHATDLAGEIRQLLRAANRAYLGTLTSRLDIDFPFVTLVVPALAGDGSPLLLLSDLSDHAKNLQRNQHASLLFDGTLDRAEPLTGPRVTLIGTLKVSEAAEDRETYLAQRPEAGLYAGFGDFRFYRFYLLEALFVAGFGRIHRLTAAELAG
jgi:putative heme iron utilization protein